VASDGGDGPAGGGEEAGAEEEPKASEQESDTPAGLSYRQREELADMEERIVEAEARKEQLERELSDPELYDERPGEVPKLNAELEDLEEQIGALYDRWEELESRKSD